MNTHAKKLKSKRLRLQRIVATIALLACFTTGFCFISIDKLQERTFAQTQTQPLPPLEQADVNTEPAHRFADITFDNRAERLPILMYHDVQDIATSDDNNVMPLAEFAAQLQYLHDNGFTTISATEFSDAYHGKIALPKKSVMLTFDDGFQSIRTLVDPLLQKYDFYATSFIVGSYTQRPDWHLTTEQIAEVAANGHVEFQSHTFDLHHDGIEKGIINEVSTEQIVADHQAMTNVLGYAPHILCYPFGAYSDTAMAGLQAADIAFGFAIHTGTSNWVYLNENHSTPSGEIQNPHALPRVRINANLPLATFAQLVSD